MSSVMNLSSDQKELMILLQSARKPTFVDFLDKTIDDSVVPSLKNIKQRLSRSLAELSKEERVKMLRAFSDP